MSAKRKPRLLVTMFNVSWWSGLHENVWFGALAAHRAGWDVTVACSHGPLADLFREEGITFYEVTNWKKWREDAKVLAQTQWDVIHTHPFASRELGVAVARETGAPVVSTFHGNYLDKIDSWNRDVTKVVTVCPAHADMIHAVPGCEQLSIDIVRNAARDELFDLPIRAASDILEAPRHTIVVAARIASDKRAMLTCIDAVTSAIAAIASEDAWEFQVLGEGKLSAEVSEFIAAQTKKSENLSFAMHGLVDSEEVPRRMQDASLTIASGRGAIQSLAVGTPVVAFGSQGTYGLQYDNNLELGLRGNFGGYPLDHHSDMVTDVTRLMTDSTFYARVQADGRTAAAQHLKQSDADAALLQAIEHTRELAKKRPFKVRFKHKFPRVFRALKKLVVRVRGR